MVRGDEYYMAVCNTTGSIAIYNRARTFFVSSRRRSYSVQRWLDESLNLEMFLVWQDIQHRPCPVCAEAVDTELQTMNIQMRIITEDNGIS